MKPITLRKVEIATIKKNGEVIIWRRVCPQPKNVKGPNYDGQWSETIDPVTRYFSCPFGATGEQRYIKAYPDNVVSLSVSLVKIQDASIEDCIKSGCTESKFLEGKFREVVSEFKDRILHFIPEEYEADPYVWKIHCKLVQILPKTGKALHPFNEQNAGNITIAILNARGLLKGLQELQTQTEELIQRQVGVCKHLETLAQKTKKI